MSTILGLLDLKLYSSTQNHIQESSVEEIMAETTKDILGRKVWVPEDMEKDLRATGLLEDFFFLIHTNMAGWSRCTGLCGAGNPMWINWVADKHLIVCMKTYHQRMIDAFSAVVGYKPFCKYRYQGDEGSLWVTEWSKEEYSERIQQIKSDPMAGDFGLLD